jgi:hypothetical protein
MPRRALPRTSALLDDEVLDLASLGRAGRSASRTSFPFASSVTLSEDCQAVST